MFKLLLVVDTLFKLVAKVIFLLIIKFSKFLMSKMFKIFSGQILSVVLKFSYLHG
jgi:hypothetical protein